MPIPFYLCEAHGGQVMTIDDRSVVKDLASAAGAGGNAFTADLTSAPIGGGGYNRLRHMMQRVHHTGAVTVVMTPLRDGAETGNEITRTLAAADSHVVDLPAAESGTDVQVKVTLSSFDAEVALGAAQLWVNTRRGRRA